MRWMQFLSIFAITLIVCAVARADDAKINTQVVLGHLEDTWEASKVTEGGFKEELHLGPALTGQWHQSAKALPVTIAWFVEGNELRILYYESVGDAFNYRVKTVMVPYELSADRLRLTLTLNEKPTTWVRAKRVESEKP